MRTRSGQLRPTDRHSPTVNRARRGVMTLGALLVVVILIGLMAIVLETAYLYLVLGDMQQRADLLARAGAPALLDEDRLLDASGPPQPFQLDDVRQARRLVHAYRRINNRVGPTALRLAQNDVRIRAGYVADPTSGRHAGFFDSSGALPTPRPAVNTLCVRVRRSSEGANPLGRLLHGMFEADSLRLSRAAYATLDNWVIGFRPTRNVTAPVAPLGIELAAWQDERGQDSDGNEIREFRIRLESTQADARPGNAVLVDFDGLFSPGTVGEQIQQGIGMHDLPGPDHVLGPVTASHPLAVAARTNTSEAAAVALARKFDALAAAGDEACRAFPLFRRQGHGQAELIGFVAARVMAATVRQGRLVVDVEPCYLIHPTAWTVAPDDPAEPRANLYVHKLRITR